MNSAKHEKYEVWDEKQNKTAAGGGAPCRDGILPVRSNHDDRMHPGEEPSATPRLSEQLNTNRKNTGILEYGPDSWKMVYTMEVL